MRIAGYIEHPHFKITVFEVESKFLVKFEIGLFEQTYKFRKSPHIQSFQDIQSVVTPQFIKEVDENFKPMLAAKKSAMKAYIDQKNSSFDEQII